MGAVSQTSTGPESDGTFSVGRDAWLARLGNLRNVLRQELITRQLAAHLPRPPARALDVGAGQGTQAIRLAGLGYSVTAVEPDVEMRALFTAAAGEQPAQVRARLDLRAGRLGDLATTLGDAGTGAVTSVGFDVVLCHGVLMYLPSAEAAIAELAALVAPGGFLAVAARSGAFLPWRPLLRHDWEGAQRAFEELDAAAAEGRDARYVNEIGSPARSDTIEGLTSLCMAAGLHCENWYGVRIASDDADIAAPVPTDAAELARMLQIEERLGRTDPYRQLGALFHLIARRPPLPAR
jgi:S-adenosylmethionine-dependent methyltransferase